MKKVVISCGPIPARLDSVKFITNRFKGGLAFKTAKAIVDNGNFDVTIVMWTNTDVPDWCDDKVSVVKVADVFEYYNWYKDNAMNYDAFIMAAAVANLTPSNPWKGKFPSHNYSVGEKFNIEFEIAPRAIDVIKQVNPRASLIGYKLFDGTEEELISAARHTLHDAKANIIFANHPATAKTEKIAVMADNSIIHCTFDEHIQLIIKQLLCTYYRTDVTPLSETELADYRVVEAIELVKLYERTFDKFGTVAVPISGTDGWFATTSRGHKGEPVIVTKIADNTVYASGKATLNAPTLAAMLKHNPNCVIVHRHYDDPRFKFEDYDVLVSYEFPGTVEEVEAIDREYKLEPFAKSFVISRHGSLVAIPISSPDWTKYKEQFPKKYFSCPEAITEAISKAGTETLEIGANNTSEAKYVYDKYVTCENAINLTEDQVFEHEYDLVYAKNAINYFDFDFLSRLLSRTKHFIANTFLVAPAVKTTENEVSILHEGKVYHTLLLEDDTILRHNFYAHDADFYHKLGLSITPYGKNSAIVYK